VVLLFVGTNDVLKGEPLHSSRSALRDLLRVISRDFQVVVFGVPNGRNGVIPFRQKNAFNTMAERISFEFGARFVSTSRFSQEQHTNVHLDARFLHRWLAVELPMMMLRPV
jgi:hypothetical protein